MSGIDNFLQRVGGLRCGQVMLWSMALNAAFAAVLTVTIVSWPDDGSTVAAKAERLQQMREAAR